MTLVNDWVAKIDKQLKFYEPYRSRGKSVVDYYRDEAARTVGNIDLTSSGSSYNLLYSIQKPCVPYYITAHHSQKLGQLIRLISRQGSLLRCWRMC